ncbi:hypothetical protein CAPTEDRAFT_206957 [Capitella teleta]|uniref:Uncharacterized protein n=1 Tax=Capitella teleta TaxID=283909 RepID=R7UY58_CAPTE|nr:hypothetical protein CAPTEDRAFT_206957 [Capitella teleta]|eukprot:ELU08887.1 hypothetical protein CAPTEDRAFT_206957 [Capitella teleta]
MALCECILLFWTLLTVSVNACNDTPEQDLKFQWMRSLENTCQHSSFLMAKPFLELSQNRSDIYTGRQFQCPEFTGCTPPGHDGSCTSCVPAVQVETMDGLPSLDATDDLRLRSMCPWTYIETKNAKMRYPPLLVEASCLCRPSGACPCGPRGSVDSSCEAVDVPVPILVRTTEVDFEGRCVYKPQMYRLKVGCTCAMTPVAH